MSHRLTHTNIIRIHGFQQQPDGVAFFSMEYVDGPTLSAWRLQQPQQVLSWEQLQPLLQQLCAALEYAHGEGVIHRDLKPANVMLDSRGRVKLADFGIAAVVSDSMSRVSVRSSTGGTLAYMSPQQLAGHRPTATDDLYTLGVTLYELLTGKPPFHRRDITHQVLNVQAAALDERLLELGVDNPVPPEVVALIMACLTKLPEQRPQSARAVAEWLALAMAAKAAPACPTPSVRAEDEARRESATEEVGVDAVAAPARAGGRQLWVGVAAAVVAIVLLAGTWAGWQMWRGTAGVLQTAPRQGSAAPPPASLSPAGQVTATELTVSASALPAVGGLTWLSDLSEAQRRAGVERKTLLLAAGLDDCGDCTRIRNEFLASKPFQDFAKANLILACPPPSAYQPLVQELGVSGSCELLALGRQGSLVLELPWPRGGADALLGKLDEFVYEPTELYWYSNFDVAQAKAKAARKLLLVHHSRDNCPGCIPLIQGVYTEPRFKDYALKNLVLAKVGFPPREPAVQQQCQIKGCCEATVLSSDGQWLWETAWGEIRTKGGLSWVLSRLDQSRATSATGTVAPASPTAKTITVSGELKCAACLLKLTPDCQSAIQVGTLAAPTIYLLRPDPVVVESGNQIGLNVCEIPRRVNGWLQSTPVQTNATGQPVYAAARLEAVGRVPFVVRGETACLKCMLKQSPACQLVINAEHGPWKVPYYVEPGTLVERASVNWYQSGHPARATLVSPAMRKHADGHWLFTPTKLEFVR